MWEMYIDLCFVKIISLCMCSHTVALGKRFWRDFCQWAIFSFFLFCRHMYNWNIVDCDIKQPILPLFSFFSMGHSLSFYIDFNGLFSELMGLWCMAPCLPNHWYSIVIAFSYWKTLVTFLMYQSCMCHKMPFYTCTHGISIFKGETS